MRKKASRNQLLGAFGYSEPDKYCKDFENDSIAADAVNYRNLGCMCCDNLANHLLRGNIISVCCRKEHTLVIAVLKDDEKEE